LKCEFAGWFAQKDDETGLKEYNYELDPSGCYLQWQVHETNARGASNDYASLIYVALPFLCAVQCTERRNLVYNFKSLLARDTKGHVLAGLYFDLGASDKKVTLFCKDDEGRTLKKKINFDAFLQKHLLSGTYLFLCVVQFHLHSTSFCIFIFPTFSRINQKFV
jgi:hypothetical protein